MPPDPSSQKPAGSPPDASSGKRAGSPPVPSGRERPAAASRQISDALELPFILVACVAAGGGLGYLLDKRIHTSPIFTLILGIAGFAAGIFRILSSLSKDTK